MIKKKGAEWCVYTSDGKKELGCHPTEKEAKDQLAAIEANKHMSYAQRLDGIEIFAAGKHNGDDYTESDLDSMVEAFGALDFRPPLKAGHVKDKPGMPALGWIDNVRRQGSKLIADFVDMPDVVYDVIHKKLYNTVSSEIYWDLERGGKKFHRALKAVALLGADIPAVAWLKPLHEMFHDDDAEIHFAWDESQHPRVPKGSDDGGQFGPGGGGSTHTIGFADSEENADDTVSELKKQLKDHNLILQDHDIGSSDMFMTISSEKISKRAVSKLISGESIPGVEVLISAPYSSPIIEAVQNSSSIKAKGLSIQFSDTGSEAVMWSLGKGILSEKDLKKAIDDYTSFEYKLGDRGSLLDFINNHGHEFSEEDLAALLDGIKNAATKRHDINQSSKENDMDPEEIKKLVGDTVSAALTPITEMLAGLKDGSQVDFAKLSSDDKAMKIVELTNAASAAEKARKAAADALTAAQTESGQNADRIKVLEEETRKTKIEKIVETCRIPALRSFVRQYADLATREDNLHVYDSTGKQKPALEELEKAIGFINVNAQRLFTVVSSEDPARKNDANPGDEVERRVAKYRQQNANATYHQALHAVLDEDPVLKADYAQA